MSPELARLDLAVEQITRMREELPRDVDAADRAARVAHLFECEARLWSRLFELAAQRVVWRAALGAEARAQAEARRWWARAVEETAPEVLMAFPAAAPPSARTAARAV